MVVMELIRKICIRYKFVVMYYSIVRYTFLGVVSIGFEVVISVPKKIIIIQKISERKCSICFPKNFQLF